MNLTRLGFPAPLAPIAAAPRQTVAPTPAQSANVTQLLAAALNIEGAAGYLETTPHFSGQLRADLADVRKRAAKVNGRMMAEGHEELRTAVQTLSQRGNLLNRVALLLCSCPEDVAEAAANAMADVVLAWADQYTVPA